jgi:threonyl-tRNA synthetase
MNQIHSLIALRQSIAEVLAAAILELFPSASLLGGRGTSIGFYYDFILPAPLSKEQFPIIQEQMQRLLKREVVKTLEMVPISAAGLLRSRGQKLRAEEAADSSDSLVQLVRIGEFVDLCAGEPLADQSLNFPFKLVAFSDLSEGAVRIMGTAALDKEGLKKALQDKEQFQKQDYLQLGAELSLFEVEDGGWIYHPRGEWLREILMDVWRKELRAAGYSLISTPRCDEEEELKSAHQEYAQKYGGQGLKIAEIAYIGGRWMDEAHHFCGKGQILRECISSLQLMIKISKMLRFEYQIVLSASRNAQRKLLMEVLQQSGIEYLEERQTQRESSEIEVRVPNALGEWVCAAYLTLDDSLKSVGFSLFGSLERTISLLVEKDQGVLPLWLAPEQVRVFAVDPEEEEYARSVCETLRAAGYRVSLDETAGKLSQRVYEGLREKVPFSIVVGNREKLTETIQVRAHLSAKEQMMNIATFIRDHLENQ